VPLLPTGFVPAADRAQTQINLELPPGSTLAKRSVVAERARQAAMRRPGMTARLQLDRRRLQRRRLRARRRGRGAARRADRDHRAPHRAQGIDADLERELRTSWTAFPAPASTSATPTPASRCSWCCAREDPVALTAAHKAERELRGLKGIGNVSSSASLVRPEIIVRRTSRRPPTWA
jgi:multidrug efflux pump subunit AcrB